MGGALSSWKVRCAQVKKEWSYREDVSDSTSAVAAKPSSSLSPLLGEIRGLVADDSNQDPATRAKLLFKISLLVYLRKESRNWECIVGRTLGRKNCESEEPYESLRAISGGNELLLLEGEDLGPSEQLLMASTRI